MAASLFFRYFGQVMIFICDALIVYRMVQERSYHITVSVMCPVFQIGVLAITCRCDTALHAMRAGVYNLPVDPVLLRKAQAVIAVGVVVSIAAMFVLFVVLSPLTQPGRHHDFQSLLPASLVDD